MTSRYVTFPVHPHILTPHSLDRLLLLLDTGSSPSVRNTAAKQLAQLAARSLVTDVPVEDDFKSSRQHVPSPDTSAWSELLAVVARVRLSIFARPRRVTRHFLLDITLSTFKEPRHAIGVLECPLSNIFPRSRLAPSVRGRQASRRLSDSS